MAHANARLTQFGRLLLVQRITELGWPRPRPPRREECREPPPTSGWAATAPRARPGWPSAAPDPTIAHALSAAQVRRVLAARRRRRQGPHRLGYHLGMARSTVDGVLRRQHMSRLAQTDRTSGVVVRYQREHPRSWSTWTSRSWAASPPVAATASTAELLANRGRGIGYDDLHSAVDDRSRVAFSQLLPDEQATTAARFLVEAAGFFADHGVRIQRVLTDNAKASTESVTFAETAAGLGIRLKRTRRYRPQTNGKVERFHRTLLEEWAYGRLDRSNTERRRVFARWLRFYHHRRPHTSLDGLTPMTVLVNNAGGNHSYRTPGEAVVAILAA